MLKKLIYMLLSLVYPELAVEAKTGAEVHQEGSFVELLEPKFRKIFYEYYDEVPEEYSKIFHVHNSKKAQEKEFGLGAMPVWTKFGNNVATETTYGVVSGATAMPSISYVTIPKGLERTYTHDEFAQGFAVERKFFDDEQYDVIEKMSGDLGRAGRYKVETDAIEVLNDAFTTNGYDSVPLISASHPLLKTDAVTNYGTGVCSNLIEGALSDTTIKNALIMGRKQTDEAGKIVQYKYDTLYVPPELEFEALELIRSAQKVGTTDNDINSIQGRLKVVSLTFLTDSDAWFIVDSKRHNLNFYWRVRPEFGQEKNFDNLVIKYRGYMRYSFGYSDWRGIIGSAGTTA
jgi:phage major head subunit gpT-like protein